MDVYRLSVAAHIFLGIILVGFGLFWLIMYTALGRRFDTRETSRLIEIAAASRWPHVVVPYRYRLSLHWLAWLTLFALWGTGVANAKLHGTPEGALWWAKMVLFVLLLGCQAFMSRASSPGLARANFLLLLLMVVISAWVIR
jgi:hypothetical protein